MKNMLVRTSVVTVLVAFSVSGFASGDELQCSVRTLRGTYVFSATGFTINSVSGAAQPKAIIEIIEFNADGTLTVPAATRSQNGMIVRSVPSVGTYTVEENCSGTIAFDGPAFDMFLSPSGSQLWMIQTGPGSNVFQGSATRTSREPVGGDFLDPLPAVTALVRAPGSTTAIESAPTHAVSDGPASKRDCTRCRRAGVRRPDFRTPGDIGTGEAQEPRGRHA